MTTTSNLTYSPTFLGQAEQTSAANATKGKSALGKDDFLKLLVTQLKQQDPLNPMDDQNFVAQMAQFSSLEQLTNISSGVSSMTSAINQQGMINAVNFIGKSVQATGNTITKSGDTISPVYYTLSDAASSVTVNIFDSNGNIVRTGSLGAQAAGDQTFAWDGKDYSGTYVDDGTYSIAMSAVAADGSALLVTPQVNATVTGVSSSNGTYVLTTSDGRKISLSDITKINNTSTTTAS